MTDKELVEAMRSIMTSAECCVNEVCEVCKYKGEIGCRVQLIGDLQILRARLAKRLGENQKPPVKVKPERVKIRRQ